MKKYGIICLIIPLFDKKSNKQKVLGLRVIFDHFLTVKMAFLQ